MPLPATQSIQNHDLVVLIHFDSLNQTCPDRLVPCPFDGYVESVNLMAGGSAATSGWLCDMDLVRGGSVIETESFSWGTILSADDRSEVVRHTAADTTMRFQAGDVLEFDSTAGGAGSSSEPITATVVLRRL